MADSNIKTLIDSLTASRDKIRDKFVGLGISSSSDKLSDLAEDAENIANRGAMQIKVYEGQTVEIPAGYHSGGGTVTGVKLDENEDGTDDRYMLQAKTVTPTKKQQPITPDSGYYGLSSVTVAPIPDAYQDVTSVTATAADVLSPKVFVTKNGTATTGTMKSLTASVKVTPNDVLSTTNGITSYQTDIGTGYISIGKAWIQAKAHTPAFNPAGENITAGEHFIDKVTIPKVPDTGITTDQVLATKTYYNNGALRTGGMTNNGAINGSITPSSELGMAENHYWYKVPKGYHDGNGYVGVTADAITVTPTEETFTTSYKTNNKFITEVTVNAINKTAKLTEWTNDADAAAGNILKGKTAYVDGVKVTGTMPINGTSGKVIATLTGLTTDSMSYTIPAGYHNGQGTVSLTSAIEEALAAI